MTNLSLDRLKEVTGVFISESDFQVIQLEYSDYLKESNLADTESNAEQFYEDWKEEQEILGTFTETSDGNIKYYSMDGADDVKPTTKECMVTIDVTLELSNSSGRIIFLFEGRKAIWQMQ